MVLQQLLFNWHGKRRRQNLMPIQFYWHCIEKSIQLTAIFLASNFQTCMIVYLHINSNISTDVKYLWLLLFFVQLELLFELCLSGGFTIACMGDFLLIYSGHKSSKASIRPKSINYSTSYPTTNPTRPPWLITKSSRFIRSTSCGYEPKITLTSSS